MKVLDLFSGIGGFSLGLERAGFTTVAFCEIDPYCQKVLCKHWPAVPIYNDIRELTAERLAADGIAVDVLSGGFPCQDISVAGNGGGIRAERSGLWSEYARLIGELRPRYAIVENVTALLHRGLDTVLGDLAALGYDAEWHCIPASAIGAPHRRDRVWIVAYSQRSELRRQSIGELGSGCEAVSADHGQQRLVADSASSNDWIGDTLAGSRQAFEFRNGSGAGDVANPDQSRLAFASTLARSLGEASSGQQGDTAQRSGWWSVEPELGRVAHGVPKRVDRLRGLGNAVVPQIVEMIGRAVMEIHDAR